MPVIRASNQASTTFQGVDFKGLLYAIDARSVDKPFVIDGRNFLVDAKGPYAAFANRIACYTPLYQPKNGRTFRVLTDSYTCVPGAILKFDTATSRYYPAYTFIDDGSQWPWSFATCGGNYFFCRKGLGVLMYTPGTGVWTLLQTGVPNDPRCITQSFGRLIIVGVSQTVWSALDDGTNFIPSETTGAGFQGHTIVSGVAEGLICKQINDGVLIYTDNGCYKGQLSLIGTSPFRWFTVDRSRIPINPFCFADIDDTTHVVLDAKGMYQTSDGTFAEFDAIMSEYLRTQQFPNHDLTGAINNNFRLAYDEVKKLFFIHIARDSIAPLYDFALVKYIPKDEWGRFDYQHYFTGEISYTGGPEKGFNSGFIDQFGYFRRFIADSFAEAPPSSDAVIVYTPTFEIPTRQQNIQDGQSVWVCASELHITTESEALFQNNLNPQPGVYTIDTFNFPDPDPADTIPVPEVAITVDVEFDDWSTDTPDTTEDWATIADGTADEDWQSNGAIGVFVGSEMDLSTAAIIQFPRPYIAQTIAMNSWIRVGMIRFEEAQYNDEIGCVTDITVGCDAVPGQPVYDDYMVDNSGGFDIIDDWAIGSGTEDWGVNINLTTSFDLDITGYMDDAQTIFQDDAPVLAQYSTGPAVFGGSQFFVCECNGLYHAVQISANKPGQTFHLKLLELSGFMAGRL